MMVKTEAPFSIMNQKDDENIAKNSQITVQMVANNLIIIQNMILNPKMEIVPAH